MYNFVFVTGVLTFTVIGLVALVVIVLSGRST